MYHHLAHIYGTLLIVTFFFSFFAAICTIFQQTTCTMIPSPIMHLYDYQSSVNIITMCWLFGDFSTRCVSLKCLVVLSCSVLVFKFPVPSRAGHVSGHDAMHKGGKETEKTMAADQLGQREGVVPKSHNCTISYKFETQRAKINVIRL